jgi:CRP-like cAMP-binding protein
MVSRVMNDLRRQGFIEADERGIVLHEHAPA